MNDYINNIRELKKNERNIAALNKLNNIKYSSGEKNKYEIKLNKNNLISVFYKEKALTSTYAPIEEAKKIIDKRIKKGDVSAKVGVFLSIASFYHIEYFLSLNENNKAVIIEKDAGLAKSVLENIKSEKLKNVALLLDEDIKSVVSFFNSNIEEEEAKKIIYIRHIRTSNINEETKNYYDEIHLGLANLIKEKLLSLTSNYYFAPVWARNVIYNVRFNEGYSLKTYKNVLNKETPLLLVSAGASIDDYMKEIKELSESHFVLSLSHALNALTYNGIKPDAIVSTDGGFYSSIHIINSINEDIPIFTARSAYPFPLTNIDEKRIFYFSHDESLEKIVYKRGDVYFPMEGSVIMPALRIAYALKPKHIILAGCDFCHLKDKTHSKYSNATALDFINSNKLKTFESLKYKRLNDDQKIECYDDIFRNTSSSLLIYKNRFESLIKELTKNVEIFNLTKESAKIESVKKYDSGAKNAGIRKNIKIKNPIKENINKYEFSKTLKELERLKISHSAYQYAD